MFFIRFILLFEGVLLVLIEIGIFFFNILGIDVNFRIIFMVVVGLWEIFILCNLNKLIFLWVS